MENLLKIAKEIPSLGTGGISIRNHLIDFAKNLNDGVIVEIGPWLGSATSYLSYGALNNKKYNPKIYCFDMWNADEEYHKKLKKYHNIEVPENSDILHLFLKYMNPFIIAGSNISPIKIDIRNGYKWNGKKIGLLVDDISNYPDIFCDMIKTFSPYFIPGHTILLLMDFLFYKTKPEIKRLKYQKIFMGKNKKSFKKITEISGSKTAVFKYIGGNIRYEKE